MNHITTGIYLIHNTINNKCYIGESINVEQRLKQHKRNLKKQRHHNQHLQNSFNKYGETNFKFISLISCKESELDQIEKNTISLYNSTNPKHGYNKESGGLKNKRLSNEHKKKISIAVSGRNNGMYGKTLTEEHKQKLSKIHKGKKLSEEHKQKIGKANTGINNGMYGAYGEKNHFYGKHHTEESKKKMREARIGKYCGENSPNYGKKFSEEHKKRISESKTKKYPRIIKRGFHKGKQKYSIRYEKRYLKTSIDKTKLIHWFEENFKDIKLIDETGN